MARTKNIRRTQAKLDKRAYAWNNLPATNNAKGEPSKQNCQKPGSQNRHKK